MAKKFEVTEEKLNEIKIKKPTVITKTLAKINDYVENGELQLPATYSPANALNAAYLILQEKGYLQSCSGASIAISLLDMVVQGLNPLKEQCYFIPYGTTLKMQSSYFGKQKTLKDQTGAEDVVAQVVYENDKFETTMKNGRIIVTNHAVNPFGERGKPLGAYCIIEFGNGKPNYTEIMTYEEIQNSWKMGKIYKSENGSSAHKKFIEPMMKKTVIGRASKKYINTSSDSNLLKESLNRNSIEDAEENFERVVNEEANSQELYFEPEIVTPEQEIEIVGNAESEKVEISSEDEKVVSDEQKNKDDDTVLGLFD